MYKQYPAQSRLSLQDTIIKTKRPETTETQPKSNTNKINHPDISFLIWNKSGQLIRIKSKQPFSPVIIRAPINVEKHDA